MMTELDGFTVLRLTPSLWYGLSSCLLATQALRKQGVFL